MLHTMMRHHTFVLLFLLAPLLADTHAVEEVHFVKGAKGTILRGVLDSKADRSYVFSAKKDQTVSLDVQSIRSTNLVFRVFPEKQTTGADVISNYITGDSKASGVLPQDGRYMIQLSIQRAAARRGISLPYTVSLKID